ncbi:MAG TPA: hypothetical protein VKV73_26470, partial [Chloroflexota bacterium]|nr:hypothetical protein [Chloroflexota bacterium]
MATDPGAVVRADAVWEAWNDPREVMPHLAEQCRQWTVALQQLDQDLAVVQGAVDPGEHLSAIAHEARRIQLQEWLTTIRAQLLE